MAGAPVDAVEAARSGLSRRSFLTRAGVGVGGSIFAAGFRWAPDPAFAIPIGPQPQKIFSTVLRRREDQLRVGIEFWNLTLDDSDGVAALRKVDVTIPAYVVYQFGPQHLADEAYFIGESGSEALESAGNVGARLSGGTRLAFDVPYTALPLTFTTEQLLDWLPMTPRVTTRALARDIDPGAPLAPVAPDETQTAVEYPWRLQLSPHHGSAWAHDIAPVDHGTGRYELWHTRLAVRGQDDSGAAFVDEDDDHDRTVRAVWATDPMFGYHVNDPTPDGLDGNSPFRMSLTARDRLDIVRLSSDFRLGPGRERLGAGNKDFRPEVVEVDRLMLSSLGAWMTSSFVNELVYKSGNNYNTSLLQWHHIGAMGRDSYARVVNKGYLFPFGFKAALVKVTERRFERPAGFAPQKGAYLRQRMFLVILKADRRFGGLLDTTIPFGGRELPFRRLTCLTRITPDLDQPQPYISGDPSPTTLFVPKVGTTPFRFQMRGFDWTGQPHTFDAPVVFVADPRAYAAGDVAAYLDKYHEDVAFHGARIALADEHRPGDTTFPVHTVRFAAEAPTANYDPDALAQAGRPAFYPRLERATIALSDAGAVAGREVGTATMKPYQGYLESGFGSTGPAGAVNRGDVFLEIADGATPPALGVSTRNAGGMAAPALPVKSVSRLLGPTGPAGGSGQNLLGSGVAGGAFDPADVLDDSVKILGGIALVEVIQGVGDFVTERERALKITSTRAENPHRVITELDWHPRLQAAPVWGANLALLWPEPSAGCDIHAEIVTPLDAAGKSSFQIDGRMTNFVVNLFGGDAGTGAPTETTFVRVPFRRFTFRAGTMVAETMEPELGEITFHGPLEFLDQLADYMALVPGSGGGGNLQALAGSGSRPANGPYLDVTDTGIEAGIGLAIPEIGVGVLTLSNLSLAAGLRLPFDGSRVTLTFNFSSRDNPFSLTVWGIGGGGFAAMTFSIDGVEGLEFSLEFGAAIGISIAGLASGKVELKAGINFKIETKTVDGTEIQECTLTAYVRLHGAIDILGLIEVSLTFYVGLSFIASTKSLAGEATLTVEIDLLVFSDSVELTVRKEIAGPGSGSGLHAMAGEPLALEPPRVTWADLLTQTDWEQYATSFATLGA